MNLPIKLLSQKSLPQLFVPLNIHMLLGATCFFIIGIIHAAYSLSYTYTYTCVLCSFLLPTVIGLLYKKKSSILTVFMLCAGFIIGHIRYTQQHDTHQKFYADYQGSSISIQGTILDITTVYRGRMKQCIKIQVNQILLDTHITDKNWQPIDATFQVYTPTVLDCVPSDSIKLEKISIKKPNNESFERYLIKEGINATVFYTPANDQCSNYQLMHRPRYSLYRSLFMLKQKIYQQLQAKMSPQSFTLLSSLFLGNRFINKQKVDQLADQFKQWGISHYLARSGLHLTIFALIWYAFLRLLPIAFFFKQFLLLLLGITYFMLSWSSVSFLRAFYSFLLCSMGTLLGAFFGVRSQFLHTLTLVTLFILFLSPAQLFFLDFQLSFLLTFGLAWISNTYRS